MVLYDHKNHKAYHVTGELLLSKQRELMTDTALEETTLRFEITGLSVTHEQR